MLVLERRPERQALLGRVSGGRRGGCPLGQRLAGAIFLLPRQAPACGHHLFVFETLDFFPPPFFPFLSFGIFSPSFPRGRRLHALPCHVPERTCPRRARSLTRGWCRFCNCCRGWGAGGASPCFPQACNQWRESFYRALHEARRAQSLGPVNLLWL